MKRKHPVLKFMVIILLISSLMIGCSSTNSGTVSRESNESGESSNTSSSSQPEKVTLRFSWWGAQERNKATLDAIERYMELNPHVTIQGEYMDYSGFYEKLVAQLAGGTAPDVMAIVDRWYFDLVTQNEFLADLGEYENIIDFSTVPENFMETQLFNGKKIGFPAGLQGDVLIYNNDFFEKYNIPADTQWTWDSLIEVGKKVHDEDPNAYLLSLDAAELNFVLRVYQKQLTGNQFIKDDYTLGFTKEDMIKMLTFVRDIFEQNVAEPLASAVLYPDVSQHENPKWRNGEMGITHKYTSLIPVYQQVENFNLGVGALPLMEGFKDPGTFTGSTLVYVMNKGTEYPEETAKFLNWLVNDPEAIKLMGTTRGVPATKVGQEVLGEANLIDPLVQKALDLALENSSKVLPDNAISQNQELTIIFTDIIDQVGFGELTPEQGSEQLIALLEDKLAQMK
ncbi:ABC transporter substrate-binding protein [Paenibacillus abyssi]|uniref:ABC transporter substrate-binding protein n=1 Tax=Paenibacillus abyssi TaxID=1340531 RepID=A0A917LFR5_9BACL|nr:ABC transporter substrate-binding protein [Paenibacillus abyssi]GGG18939.1 ABC transporter substrate-binding protein [Paenibacillus abyssi]